MHLLSSAKWTTQFYRQKIERAKKTTETLSLFVLSQSDLVLDVTKNRDKNMEEDLKQVTPILFAKK